MVYLDPPAWPYRGRLWSHLVSDVSYAELHVFAEMLGSPRRAFDRDHYDLPADRFAMAVALGATVVSSREIVAPAAGVGAAPAQAPQRSRAPSSRMRLARAGSVHRSASSGVPYRAGSSSSRRRMAARPARNSASGTNSYSWRTAAAYAS